MSAKDRFDADVQGHLMSLRGCFPGIFTVKEQQDHLAKIISADMSKAFLVAAYKAIGRLPKGYSDQDEDGANLASTADLSAELKGLLQVIEPARAFQSPQGKSTFTEPASDLPVQPNAGASPLGQAVPPGTENGGSTPLAPEPGAAAQGSDKDDAAAFFSKGAAAPGTELIANLVPRTKAEKDNWKETVKLSIQAQRILMTRVALSPSNIIYKWEQGLRSA